MSKCETDDGRAPRGKQDYEVGYGKPPRASRFQRGRSGHKGHRRKRSTTLGMDIKKALNAKVTVHNGDNGEPIKMTEREYAVAGVVRRAMKGDMAAIKLVLKLDREGESVERAAARAFEESQPKVFKWTAEQEKLFQELMRITNRKIED
jgi:Family of unknown function (DUF5681)